MQYQGYWYCPTEPGQLLFEERLAAKKAEFTARKAARRQRQQQQEQEEEDAEF